MMFSLPALDDFFSPWGTMLDASFRGVPFQLTGITDKAEKALAIHEYPYRPGAEIEDLGRRPREIPVKAVFFGSGYLSGVMALVRALEEDGKGELVHPLFGSLEVCVKSWSVEHDVERRDYATVDFECVEAALDNPFFEGQSMRGLADSAQDALNAGLASALDEAQLAFADAMLPLQDAAAYVQGAVLAELSGILSVYDMAGEVARSVLSYVDYPLGFVSDLLACQSFVVEGVAALDTFSGLCALSGVLPLLPLSGNDKPRTYPGGPGAYGASWVVGPQQSRAVPQRAVRGASPASVPAATYAPGSRQTPYARAVTCAMLAQTRDIASAAASALARQTASFSPGPLGVSPLSTAAPVQIMTPAEIESLTGNTRARLGDCLTYVRASLPADRWHRAADGLREAAQGIQQMGEAALNARPPLITHAAERSCNARLLAYRLYGDHTRARELVRINPQVRNPNFIAQGQELLVYAR